MFSNVEKQSAQIRFSIEKIIVLSDISLYLFDASSGIMYFIFFNDISDGYLLTVSRWLGCMLLSVCV